MYTIIFLVLTASFRIPTDQKECLMHSCGPSRACVFVEGEVDCQEDAPTCQQSLACSFAGHCTDHEDGTTCLATSAEDCAASKLCEIEGLCAFEFLTLDGHETGRCIPTDRLTCRRLAACRNEGRCTFEGHKCAVTSNADCRHLARCKGGRVCNVYRMVAGRSFQGCTSLKHSADWSRDEDGDDYEACENTPGCNDYGQCYFNGKTCASKPVKATCKRFSPVAVKRVTASSSHSPALGYDFGPESLTDDDPKTSWQPAWVSKWVHDGGVGEWLRFELESPTEVSRIQIRNGFQHRDPTVGDLFYTNNRVDLLALWRSPTAQMTEPGDVMGRGTSPDKWFVMPIDYAAKRVQTIDIPPTTYSTIYLEIGAIEHGTRWDDLAISDIRFERCAD